MFFVNDISAKMPSDLRTISFWVILLSLSITTTNAYAVNGIELSDERRSHLTSLLSISSNPVTGENLANKLVVVTFFASWCPPCRKEFQILNRLRDEFSPDDLTIVAVNVFEDFNDNDETRLKQFLSDTAPEFHIVKGIEETKRLFGNINRIPTLFVFDREGQAAMRFIHRQGSSKSTAELDELRNAIKSSLKTNS